MLRADHVRPSRPRGSTRSPHLEPCVCRRHPHRASGQPRRPPRGARNARMDTAPTRQTQSLSCLAPTLRARGRTAPRNTAGSERLPARAKRHQTPRDAGRASAYAPARTAVLPQGRRATPQAAHHPDPALGQDRQRLALRPLRRRLVIGPRPRRTRRAPDPDRPGRPAAASSSPATAASSGTSASRRTRPSRRSGHSSSGAAHHWSASAVCAPAASAIAARRRSCVSCSERPVSSWMRRRR